MEIYWCAPRPPAYGSSSQLTPTTRKRFSTIDLSLLPQTVTAWLNRSSRSFYTAWAAGKTACFRTILFFRVSNWVLTPRRPGGSCQGSNGANNRIKEARAVLSNRPATSEGAVEERERDRERETPASSDSEMRHQFYFPNKRSVFLIEDALKSRNLNAGMFL